MEEYGLLERLLHEQCRVGRHRDGRPSADDDDAAEGKVPIALREPGEVRSSSMQTPHDPEVTYSGHKGKGYEVQVSETCEEGDTVQMITHVEVTPSSDGDAGVTVGVIDELRERGIGPSELWCDTSYGSGRNGWEAERRGTELVSPLMPYQDGVWRTTTTSSATTQAPTGTTKYLTPNRPHAAEPTRKALVTRESGYDHDLAKRGRALQGAGLSSMHFHPTGGGPEDDKDGQDAWFTARIASLIG